MEVRADDLLFFLIHGQFGYIALISQSKRTTNGSFLYNGDNELNRTINFIIMATG